MPKAFYLEHVSFTRPRLNSSSLVPVNCSLCMCKNEKKKKSVSTIMNYIGDQHLGKCAVSVTFPLYVYWMYYENYWAFMLGKISSVNYPDCCICNHHNMWLVWAPIGWISLHKRKPSLLAEWNLGNSQGLNEYIWLNELHTHTRLYRITHRTHIII